MKRRNIKLRTLKKTGTKLRIVLKSRTGCSKFAAITTRAPMSKGQTKKKFFKHYHSEFKKQ